MFSRNGSTATEWTTKEAAVLSGMNERRVRKLARELRVGRRGRGGSHRQVFGPRDVLFLSLTQGLPVAFDRKTATDLYALVSRGERTHGSWRVRSNRLVLGDILEIDPRKVRGELSRRLRTYSRGPLRITADPDTMGGESVFKGTRISVAHVGALAARGVPLAEILEDYPRLNTRDVELALLLYRMGRRPGRSRKLLALRR